MGLDLAGFALFTLVAVSMQLVSRYTLASLMQKLDIAVQMRHSLKACIRPTAACEAACFALLFSSLRRPVMQNRTVC